MPYDLSDTLLTVTFAANSGLAADRVVHSFAFRHALPVPSEAQRQALHNAVNRFYNSTNPGQANSVATYMSGWLSRVVPPVQRQTRIVSGPLGSPLRVQNMDVLDAPGSAQNYPAEMAVRLGIRADVTGIPEEAGAERPRGSRRGGPYIGPLADLTGDGGSADNPNVAVAMRTDLSVAAGVLQDEAATALWDWSIWSRDDQELYRVVEVRVDNAFDVQRKRGTRRTAETVLAVA